MFSHVNTAEIRPGNPISGLGVLLRNIEYDFDRVRPPPPAVWRLDNDAAEPVLQAFGNIDRPGRTSRT